MPMLGKRDVNSCEFHRHWAAVWIYVAVALVLAIMVDWASGRVSVSPIAMALVVVAIVLRVRDAWNTRKRCTCLAEIRLADQPPSRRGQA